MQYEPWFSEEDAREHGAFDPAERHQQPDGSWSGKCGGCGMWSTWRPEEPFACHNPFNRQLTEELVFGRIAYTGEGEPIDHSEDVERLGRDSTIAIWTAAPGFGKRVWRVTRVDEAGVWGTLIEDTADSGEGG